MSPISARTSSRATTAGCSPRIADPTLVLESMPVRELNFLLLDLRSSKYLQFGVPSHICFDFLKAV